LPLFGLGGLILFFWFLSRAKNAYDAATVMDTSKAATATVSAGALTRRDESTYTFEVDGQKYSGRCDSNLAKGATLESLYDPNAPETNRPANGLWFDIGAGAGLFILLLGIIVWLIPFRRMSAYPEPQNPKVRELISDGHLLEAVESFNARGATIYEQELPRVAESALAAWRKRPELAEKATEALKRLEKMGHSPAIARNGKWWGNGDSLH
jgi:hypothetical protein